MPPQALGRLSNLEFDKPRVTLGVIGLVVLPKIAKSSDADAKLALVKIGVLVLLQIGTTHNLFCSRYLFL